MARKRRIIMPGVPQHVIQRGNNRQVSFFTDQDYSFYLESMNKAADKFNCAVHTYVLMTNHVHLLVTEQAQYGVSCVADDAVNR